MIEEKTAKRINPARRERLNKGWPIKVYTYDCWPQEKPPQALWDTAHEIRRQWNDFTAIFRKIITDDKKDEAGKPLLSKEERAILWAPINTKPLREIAKQRKEKLDAGCREVVAVRFLTTVGNWRENPYRFGPPRFQQADEMNAISIPLVYNDGKSAEWLIGAKFFIGADRADPMPSENERQGRSSNIFFFTTVYCRGTSHSLVSQSHNRIDPRGSPRRNITRCQRHCREQYWNRRERKRI
jgi:hypothetical protein